MPGHTNRRVLTTVKCFCNNDIIMLRVKDKNAACDSSRRGGEAKNKASDMAIAMS